METSISWTRRKPHISALYVTLLLIGCSTFASAQNAVIRLVNGTRPSQGRVEVYHGNQWGTVCDDSFDRNAAIVVCRQLGFTGNMFISRPQGYFGAGTGNILLDDVVCVGNETSLFNCRHRAWGTSNCAHNEDVGVDCRPDMDAVIPVRLADGSSGNEGRVEIMYKGVWGTVCDDEWDDNSATVVCKQLGFANAIGIPLGNAYFGNGTGNIWLDDVKCTGQETGLGACEHKAWGRTNCDHHEDAGVMCIAAGTSPSLQVQLTGGLNMFQGRVMLNVFGHWGSVCDDKFDQAEADVVCRMLGHHRGGRVLAASTYSGGSGPIWLDDLECTGNETSLADCVHKPWGVNNCDHNEDAAVLCLQDNPPTLLVRLANATSSGNGGRVEVNYQGTWGTVCDDKWSASDAAVVCRMLQKPFSGAVAVSHAAYGQGPGPILMDNVECIGTEQSIGQCRFNGWTINDCSHSEDAGVICQDNNLHTQIRLVGGQAGPFEGRVEIQYNNSGVWGTICDDSFDSKVASVICGMLNYPTQGAVAKGAAFFGRGNGSILLDDLDCTGFEQDIALCGHRGWGNTNCDHSEDASVICQALTRQNTTVRLRGGPSTSEGRLEVFHQGKWGTVCDDDFDTKSAAVVCNMLGLPSNGAQPRPKAFYGRGTGTIWLDNVHCSGSEYNIDICDHQAWGSSNCDHTEDVGVLCDTATNVRARLVNGSSTTSGRLELFYNNTWGTVCDDGFNGKDAQIVCRMLGLQISNALPIAGAYYGQGAGPILLDDVSCLGSETNIVQCANKGWYNHNCQHNEDVAVNCNSGAIRYRLVNGTDRQSGRVEIYLNGQWGTVCDDKFDNNAAKVVCKALGMPYQNAIPLSGASFGQGKGQIWLDDTTCFGNESSLLLCNTNAPGDNDCTHEEDVGVICTNSAATSNIQYRLSGGPSTSEGRLEIYYAGKWGTVCDDNFDSHAATVVCNKLGVTYVKASVGPSGKYGPGTGPIWLDDVTCSGTEGNLTSCNHSSFGVNDCTHSEDVGVMCSTTAQLSFNVRLKGGPVPRKGRVEIQTSNGQWGTVCDDGWGMTEATVVCNSLGYKGSIAVPLPSAYYGNGTGQIVLDNVNCIGNETNIGQCDHKPIGVNDCDHTEDASVMCLQRGVAGFNVRLAGGLRRSAGRLEVRFQGVWGTVCDDSFGDINAGVVCRQLGFSGGRHLNGIGSGRGPIWMDDVKCTGSETSLNACKFAGWSINNCDHSEDVGVACNDSTAITYKARLSGGTNDHEGRVEVMVNNQWGTVCDDQWSNADAAVVCRMLGFSTDGARALSGATATSKYGQGQGSIYLDDVRCIGTESNLGLCSSNAAGLSNCNHNEDAGVVCQGGQVTTLSVRLQGGSNYNEGRVEVFYNNTWGTICDDNWNQKSAQVFCNMLGFQGTALPRMGGFFHNGNGTIWLDDVNCLGNETALPMCGHASWGVNNCGHSEDAGVVCGASPQVSAVRLRGGTTSSEGRVEIYHNGTWGTICDDNVDHNFAVVICKKLGFSTNNVAVRTGAFYGPGSGPIWLDDVTCAGDESSIDNCVYRPWGTNNCGHNEDVSVLCSVPTARIRLVPPPGAPVSQGRLEVFYNNTWGTVCDDSFNTAAAGVVCSMLGYPRAGAVARGSAAFGQGTGPILLDDLKCTGQETNLLQCNGKPWYANNCDHSEDVGVVCGSVAVNNIRLAAGPNHYQGRVEVFHNGTWGTVCDDRFTQAAAQVVCGMLNFTRSHARVISMSYAGGSTTTPSQIWLDEVRCNGNEMNIDDCLHNAWGVNDCLHREDVAVACPYTTLPTLFTVPPTTPSPNNVVTYARLAQGHTAYEGRVELYYKGQWGTVCDDQWSSADASVVCGMLGYPRNGAAPFSGAQYGAGLGQIWLDDVNCGGTEASIAACASNSWGVNNCGHSEDASVSCSTARLPDNFLLFTDTKNKSINRMDLTTQSYVQIPLTRSDNPIAIDYDPIAGYIYWTDVGLKEIRTASIYGQGEKTIRLLGNASVADGIAIDPISRLIFYTDTGYNIIAVLTLDGSDQAVLVSSGLDEPRAITLDVLNAKMYWSDWSASAPKISTANYDGSGVRDIITTNLGWPNAIALDTAGSRIFWADSKTHNIEVAYLDGTNRQVLMNDPTAHYFGLVMYQSTLFYTNWRSSTMMKVLTSGQNKTTFGPPGFGRLNDVHLHKNGYGPTGTNACTNGRGGCSHICIPKGNDKQCLCPTGLSLRTDGVSCGKSYPCPALQVPIAGSLTPATCTSGQSQPGSACKVTCNQGYRYYGGASVTCNSNGQWSNGGRQVLCRDVTPPTIQCPGNVVVTAAKGQQTAIATWPDITVTDNSGLMPTLFQSMRSGTTLTAGTYGVNVLANDAAGLPASCSFTVTVKVLQCASRNPPQNGYILSGICPNYYGAVCILGCKTGYHLSNNNSTGQITCNVDNSGRPFWTGTGLSCIPGAGTGSAAQTGASRQSSPSSSPSSSATTVPVVVGVVVAVVLLTLIIGGIFVYLRKLQYTQSSGSAPIAMGNVKTTTRGWDNPNYADGDADA